MFNIDSKNKFIIAVCFSSATLLPGMLLMLVFTKKAFYFLDFWKIFVLSFAITIPIFSLNFLLNFSRLSERNKEMYKDKDNEKYEKKKKGLVISSCFYTAIFTGLIYYAILCAGFILGSVMTKMHAIVSIIILEIVYLFFIAKTKDIKNILYLNTK